MSIREIIDNGKREHMSEKDLVKALAPYSVDVEDMAYLDVMDIEEETELVDAIAKGDKVAFDTLCDKHMCLVTSIAVEYIGQGLDIYDILDAGEEGLREAGRRYDRRVGYQFAVHAVWWIRQTIVKLINANK